MSLAFAMLCALTTAGTEAAIADLDSQTFLVRQRASERLAKEGAILRLCLAADEPCSLERKIRLEKASWDRFHNIPKNANDLWMQEVAFVDMYFGPNYPCYDALWFNTETKRYDDKIAKELRPLVCRYEEWKAPLLVQDMPEGPWVWYRANTKILVIEEIEKGTPPWFIGIVLAEMKRRDEMWFGMNRAIDPVRPE